MSLYFRVEQKRTKSVVLLRRINFYRNSDNKFLLHRKMPVLLHQATIPRRFCSKESCVPRRSRGHANLFFRILQRKTRQRRAISTVFSRPATAKKSHAEKDENCRGTERPIRRERERERKNQIRPPAGKTASFSTRGRRRHTSREERKPRPQ